jgi:YidC/Oxa1 family membrane protein insertase
MNPEVKLCWRYAEDDEVESMDGTESDSIAERTPASIKWLAFKSQFFSLGVMADDRFKAGALLTQVPMPLTEKSEIVKKLGAEMYVPYGHKPQESHKFTLFFLPNDYNLLKKYDIKLERIVNLGWGPIKYITMLIIGIFGFLERFFDSYGVIIALLAVIIKIVLSPLTYRSYLMGAKMQVINKMPEMLAIDEKYKDNPTRLQQEKMSFYREIGFNPFAGCIPALLQMPILFAMLSFFPHSIDLRQKSFLWAEDLSTYDSIWTFGYVPLINTIYGDHVSLFALLMTISTLIFTYIQQQSQPVSANTPAALKYMPYIFPFIFLSVLNNYSAGLSYYYFVLNLLTIVQTIVIKLTLNEDKIRAAIQANKIKLAGKRAKPSRFQKWMIESQKRLEEQQRQAQKHRGNPPSKPSAKR